MADELEKLLQDLIVGPEKKDEKKEIKPELKTEIKLENKNSGVYQAPVKNYKLIGSFIPGVYLNKMHPEGHNGLDLQAPLGAPIYPIGPGVVTEAIIYPKGGKTCKISHEDGGVVSYYAHCNEVNVQVGQKVDMNTVIATVGKTGNASGTSPHLHFEVKVDGSKRDPQSVFGKPIGSLSKQKRAEYFKQEIIKETESLIAEGGNLQQIVKYSEILESIK